MKKFLATASANNCSAPSVRWVDIDENNYVDGEIPVEDFGMFLLLDEEVTANEAIELFLALIRADEGDYDYRGRPQDDKPEDYLKSSKTRKLYASII
jgi:hypothetical protein